MSHHASNAHDFRAWNAAEPKDFHSAIKSASHQWGLVVSMAEQLHAENTMLHELNKRLQEDLIAALQAQDNHLKLQMEHDALRSAYQDLLAAQADAQADARADARADAQVVGALHAAEERIAIMTRLLEQMEASNKQLYSMLHPLE